MRSHCSSRTSVALGLASSPVAGAPAPVTIWLGSAYSEYSAVNSGVCAPRAPNPFTTDHADYTEDQKVPFTPNVHSEP